MSLVIDGQRVEVPGLVTRSWLDTQDPLAPPHTPHVYRAPSRWVQPITGIVLHTVHGDPDGHIERDAGGAPQSSVDETVARAYAKAAARVGGRAASEHLIVSRDGAVLCLADLVRERTWHACGANPFTLGIELDQANDGGVFEATYQSAVVLVRWLCERFGVKKRVPARDGRLLRGVVRALNQDHGGPAGKNWSGVWGHRNNTANRGPGDPGDVVFERLIAAGFVGVDPEAGG